MQNFGHECSDHLVKFPLPSFSIFSPNVAFKKLRNLRNLIWRLLYINTFMGVGGMLIGKGTIDEIYS